MSTQSRDPLEHQLAALTVWNDPDPQVWKRALDAASKQPVPKPPRIHRILNWPLPKVLAAMVALFLLGTIAIAILLPSLGKARSHVIFEHAGPVNSSSRTAQQALAKFDTPSASIGFPWQAQQAQISDLDRSASWRIVTDISGDTGSGGGGGGLGGGGGGAGAAFEPTTAAPRPPAQASTSTLDTAPGADRQIVRKASIELTTNDVRAAFLKAAHLISEANGEYVQDSTLTGSDKTAQANLTLRVAADRLPAILNELRSLGAVVNENTTGEDVTNQVVDLEARLRNEQRVETELLQLLEKRTDAPLKEILELRDHIASVRQQIEQLTAQRERLGRLVSLASILVIIRTKDGPTPEVPADQSLGEYFSASLAAAWRNGLLFLADTLAGTLRILIGGLFWWVVLVVALLSLRNFLQRRAAEAAIRS
ncbi:MAG: DUF4349 domain-containing protein [Phycisphaerales bacterium]|nr:DUF4349 domain-containing protein [Phycisphaerales bacterium]MCI0676619.1 DUF4349 domain-containing protein [Phycisphaerales bacterium]